MSELTVEIRKPELLDRIPVKREDLEAFRDVVYAFTGILIEQGRDTLPEGIAAEDALGRLSYILEVDGVQKPALPDWIIGRVPAGERYGFKFSVRNLEPDFEIDDIIVTEIDPATGAPK